ncbi:13976_t:CDS:1, partial [Dentiscutata erythropus]
RNPERLESQKGDCFLENKDVEKFCKSWVQIVKEFQQRNKWNKKDRVKKLIKTELAKVK